MPSRLKRFQNTGHHHFITFSCHDREPYLQSPASKDLFLNTLESTHILYDFQIAGYVVMPEHIHLLVTEPPVKPLATALAILKRSVSKHHPQNPFWLTRYYDFNVSSDDKLIEKPTTSSSRSLDTFIATLFSAVWWRNPRTTHGPAFPPMPAWNQAK